MTALRWLSTEYWVIFALVRNSETVKGREGKWSTCCEACCVHITLKLHFVSKQRCFSFQSYTWDATCVRMGVLVNYWILALYLLISSRKGLVFMCTYIYFFLIPILACCDIPVSLYLSKCSTSMSLIIQKWQTHLSLEFLCFIFVHRRATCIIVFSQPITFHGNWRHNTQ